MNMYVNDTALISCLSDFSCLLFLESGQLWQCAFFVRICYSKWTIFLVTYIYLIKLQLYSDLVPVQLYMNSSSIFF